MRILAIALFCAGVYAQTTYDLGPDSQPQANVPKGSVSRYTLAPGKYFPGTPHTYSVYTSAKLDPSKPAPFMIFLDGSGALGNQQRVPVVFDNLIAKGDLPPLIGIFIDPGVLPTVSSDHMNRFERIFEYDSISGRFAEFLTNELIPEVGKKHSLSKDPNDHAICGVSTGAVGAFIAAWNRSDQFRRVLSFIGTFVSMKGADTLPALIRKSEPKPLRVFLQAGRNDHVTPEHPYSTFYAGSWPMNNQVMQQALEYAGYDVKLVLGDEAHNMRHGAAIMPEALRWLWREYPKPITVREPAGMSKPNWDPRGAVFAIISADKPWEQVGNTYPSAASPAADKEGNVFFADSSTSRIYKSDANRAVTLFKDNTGGARALRVAPDGRLYAAQLARKRIVSYGPAGDEKVVAQNVEANDLAFTANGAIYFADTAHKTVGYIAASGQKRIVYDGGEIGMPTSVALSPDQSLLVVGDGMTRFSWSFQVAADGSLVNGEPFYRVDMAELSHNSGVEGVAMDTQGYTYFADALGIQLCEQNGRCMQILSKPEMGVLTGISFGGKELNWLYVTEGGKLFRRAVKRDGAASWTVVKPPRPPL